VKEIIMQIMIDNQKVLDLPVQSTETDDGLVLWLASSQAHEVLEVWKNLDVAHRDYRYGGEMDSREPYEVHLAAVGVNGVLHMETVEPFWDGSETHNGWPLDELSPMIQLDWEGAS
jgi:hypothetical protein